MSQVLSPRKLTEVGREELVVTTFVVKVDKQQETRDMYRKG